MAQRKPLNLDPDQGPGVKQPDQPGTQAFLDALDEMLSSGEFDWASYIRDLYDGIQATRRWTPKQLEAVNNVRAKAGFGREPWPELREKDLVD